MADIAVFQKVYEFICNSKIFTLTTLIFLFSIKGWICRFLLRFIYKRRRKLEGAQSLVTYEEGLDYQLQKLLERRDLGRCDKVESIFIKVILFLGVFYE